jgi:PhnB protein
MHCDPYLYFNGRCEEAVGFYREAVGAEVRSLTRFRDAPGGGAPAGYEDKILHADLAIGATTLLATDGDIDGSAGFHGFSLSLTASSDEEAKHLFAALGEGGLVQVPLSATFFASSFAMVKDRFGVLWTIVAGMQRPAEA